MTNVAAVPILEQTGLFLPCQHTLFAGKAVMHPKRREKWRDLERGLVPRNADSWTPEPYHKTIK